MNPKSVVLALGLALAATAALAQEEEKVLNIYNWSDYIADELGQTRAAILDERQTLIATLKKLRAAAHDQQQQLAGTPLTLRDESVGSKRD